MNKIDNILIDDEITKAYFSCDLEKCKGACCTFYGQFGAPLLDEEIITIKNTFNAIKEYLSSYSLDYIKKNGLIQGYSGNYSTVCINNRDCVFVYYDNDIAKCAFEKAFLDGKISFRKPISCHLYPIRCKKNGDIILYYDKIEECKPAVVKGNQDKVLLITSLQESLKRAFSLEWYDNLKNIIKSDLLIVEDDKK